MDDWATILEHFENDEMSAVSVWKRWYIVDEYNRHEFVQLFYSSLSNFSVNIA